MTGARSRGGSAASVSRALALGGHRPLPSGTPYSREGLRVKRSVGHLALVAADYDRPGEAERASANAAEILTGAGYTITRASATRFWVEAKS